MVKSSPDNSTWNKTIIQPGDYKHIGHDKLQHVNSTLPYNTHLKIAPGISKVKYSCSQSVFVIL